MIKILFICHGNICRSPMALYYFRSLLKEKGLSGVIRADSAATSTEEIGNPVHHGTRAKLKQAGIPCEGHRAKQMTRADYKSFDYLIGMDSWNIATCSVFQAVILTTRFLNLWNSLVPEGMWPTHGTPVTLTPPGPM